MFRIMRNFVNNDNNGNHIKPHLQNVIMQIGFQCDLIHEVTTFHNPHRHPKTLSSIFCPLIYNALRIAGVAVPNTWVRYKGTWKKEMNGDKKEPQTEDNPQIQDRFQQLSQRFAAITNWRKIATYILTRHGTPLEEDTLHLIFANLNDSSFFP